MFADAKDGRATLIDVKVVPGASRSRIAGPHGEVLRVQIAAPPERGRANEALRELFARALGVPARDVTVVRGQSSARKTVRVEGRSAAEVARLLGS